MVISVPSVPSVAKAFGFQFISFIRFLALKLKHWK